MASPFSSSFSSSEIHESAIDAIIAEATDLCALEQIAALNTAHLSDSSSLPTNLETRFRKLKTLPPATVATPLPTKATSPPPPSPQRSSNNNQDQDQAEEEEKENIPTPTTHDPKPGLSSPNQPISIEPEIKKANKASAPPSPPPMWQPSCCFCFSPKKIQRRKSNAAGVGSVDDELHDIFSELGSSSSMKESRRRLNKAWKEQEKASQEAEKMVKWVKQVSARIKEASIEELMDEEFK